MADCASVTAFVDAAGFLTLTTPSPTTCVIYLSNGVSSTVSESISAFMPAKTLMYSQWRCVQGSNSSNGNNCSSQLPFINFTTTQMNEIISTNKTNGTATPAIIPPSSIRNPFLNTMIQAAYYVIAIIIIIILIVLIIKFVTFLMHIKANKGT